MSCKAQKESGVLLDPTLVPNQTYKVIQSSEDITIIEYKGDDKFIEALEQKGIEHPISSNEKEIIVSSLKTGRIDANGEFTLTCFYENASSELTGSITKLKEPNQSIEKLKGAIAFGKVNSNKQIQVDSIIGLNDESLLETIKQSLSSLNDQIEYPKEIIKIGDSFVQEIPTKFPAGNGQTLDIDLLNTFLLDSLSNSIAYFSLHQKITVRTDLEETDLFLEGEGTGFLEYDIQNKNYRFYHTELEMNSVVELKGIKIITMAVTKSTTKTEIRKTNDNKG